MAFGTPVAGALAYSTANGATVAPAYPASIAANDIVVLVVGMKPSTANGGTVTTPTGWTLRDSITGQGGYGTTLGADTGNTNLWIYTKDTVAGTETGNLTVTVGTNNVCWAAIIRIPGGGATSERYGTADGGRATAPTSGVAFTNLLTNGATAPNISAGDMVIYAMCIPTDVLGGTGFSAQTISSTGTTFATPVELREASSNTGNDIGGFIAYASATSGSSTAAPTIGATATGTVTNVRGPFILLSIRDTTQALTPSLYTNTNTFYSPTVTQATPAQNLSPALYTNNNTFYTPTVSQTGGTQTLTPARYDNTNTFYSATVTTATTLSPALYSNTNTFFTPTVARGTITLTPARYDNTNAFYSATVAAGTATISPALYTNQNTFYSPTLTQGVTLLPARYDNANTFYSATVAAGTVTLLPDRYDNTNAFYSASVSPGPVTLSPALYTNQNAFFAQTVSATYELRFEDYVDPGYVDDGYIGLAVENVSVFFSPLVTRTEGSMFSMFFP